MKKIRIVLALSGLLSLFAASPASAMMMGMVRPEILGGVNDMTNDFGSLGFTVGAGLDLGLGPSLSLSVDGLYLSRAFSVGGFSTANANYIQVPAVLHIHLFPMFSIGAGAFYDFGVNNGATKNYGLIGSVRIKPMGVPIFFEGRYNYGLDSSDWLSNTSEFQGLVGFIF